MINISFHVLCVSYLYTFKLIYNETEVVRNIPCKAKDNKVCKFSETKKLKMEKKQ